MEVINSYFKNLIFSKVDEKEGFVIYGVCVTSGLGGGTKRYVLLFVPKHLAFKPKARIHELAWQNLQTRELAYSYKLPQQRWTRPRDAYDEEIFVKDRNTKHSLYSCSLPFEILLLHTPKKKTIYQYRNKLAISSALETFNAIFNYVGETSPFLLRPPENINMPSSSYVAQGDDAFELL